MKNKNLLLILSLFFTSLFVLGQAPEKIDFQAMARDGSGNPLLVQTIGVRISVIQGATTIYTERHTPQTDDYGLFMLHIGDGTPLSGSFSNIDWSLGNHKVKVEVDPDGGYVYINMGTSVLTSTPYALYGEDDDADSENELQTLSVVGNDLTISDGNTVTLPGGGSSLWTANGDDIYYNDGMVGIGTDGPEDLLHINNPGGSANALITSTNMSYYIADASGNTGLWMQEGDTDVAWLYWNPASQAVFMYENGNQTMAWKDNKVGIGPLDPLVKLHVIEENSAGTLGSELGVLYSPSQSLSPAVFGWAENNTSDISSGVLGHAYSTTSMYNEGVFGEGGGGTNNNYGVYGVGYGQSGSTYSIAVYGDDQGAATTNYAGYFSGDVHVNGALSKSGGSFKIDHPQDPANKYLIHSFVESPDMMNVYNGNVVTDAEGLAIVKLPSYFEAENLDFKYQLTVIGQFAQAIIKEEVSGNRFTIQTDKPNVKVSWQVTGVRDDAWANAHRIVPEVEKKGVEKGKYLHPELFGKSKDLGMPVGIPQNAQYKQGSHKQAVKSASEAIGPLGVKK